ncbi:BA75_00429T0 [Komagataella pastoris]|uniref:Iron-sulfur cluster biogenesis chaperone, mitochondrial n=1 Tax=Komagataella pastoris TaxID=4922 RepID=A0A1B2J6E3_PICPA|nr:BA75_00429T0 [Komagataella pastoris]
MLSSRWYSCKKHNSSRQLGQLLRYMSSKVIGIDLGTTNSAVAVFEGKEPKILENEEGKRTTPSIVAFTPETVLVGEPAKRQSILNYQNTFYATKRLIGRKYSDPEVQRDISNVPYCIIEHENGDAWLQNMHSGQKYSPSQIGSLILGKMKQIAELNLSETVSQAVVTVPAYFNDSQRQATKIAGDLVGLKVLRVINEPTAASLAYGLNRKNDGIIAVYDLGGGTFDISILDIEAGVFEVIATNGDTHLGGEDFDHLLVDYILQQFKSQTGQDLSTDRLALQRIRQAAEKAKIDLSTVKETTIELPFITKTQHINLKLTEDQLDDMSLHLINRTVQPVKKCLRDADLTTSDIDEVILVGGMTRMPKIRKVVEETFGKKPNISVNPDEAVALGAAIQGAVLSGEIKDVLLLDVTPLTLGIETFGGIFSPLIPRNTKVPCKVQQMYSTAVDGQNSIEVNVYQGERSLVRDNKLIGQFKLSDLEPQPKGVPQIKVSFEIDADGIIKVNAKDTTTNQDASITVFGSTGLTSEEVERIVAESKNNSETDRIRKEIYTKANNLELLLFDCDNALSQWGNYMDDSDKKELTKRISDLREVIQEARDEKLEDISVLESSQQLLQTETLKAVGKAAQKMRNLSKNKND